MSAPLPAGAQPLATAHKALGVLLVIGALGATVIVGDVVWRPRTAISDSSTLARDVRLDRTTLTPAGTQSRTPGFPHAHDLRFDPTLPISTFEPARLLIQAEHP